MFALSYASCLHQGRREGQVAQEQAEAALALTTEQGFAQLFVGRQMLLRGWALVTQGQAEEGIIQMRQGLAARRAAGTGLWQPYHLALLAEAYGEVGQAEEGLTVLTEAMAVVSKTEERYYEAELYRLKGTLTLQSQTRLKQVSGKSQASQNKTKVPTIQSLTSNAQSEAEACFRKAIEIAQRQQAKSLELRATMSLARLWQQQGKAAEAHQMLSEIYNWFTEGFETKDLQEAKALLDELSH
jgi:predicted ATPase